MTTAAVRYVGPFAAATPDLAPYQPDGSPVPLEPGELLELPRRVAQGLVKRNGNFELVAYDELTVADLQEIARRRGLEGYSDLRKAELVELVAGDQVDDDEVTDDELEQIADGLEAPAPAGPDDPPVGTVVADPAAGDVAIGDQAGELEQTPDNAGTADADATVDATTNAPEEQAT